MPETPNTLPTSRQLQFLREIRRFKMKHGDGPTATELGELLGISRQTVRMTLLRMLEHGLVRHTGTGREAAWQWSVSKKGERWL